LVRKSVYIFSVSKEQQKNRCFFAASGFDTFFRLPSGSQSFSFRVISTCVKLAITLCLQVLSASPTDSEQSTPPSTQRQQDFRIFLKRPPDTCPYTVANPVSSAISSIFPLSEISTTSPPPNPGIPLPSPSSRILQPPHSRPARPRRLPPQDRLLLSRPTRRSPSALRSHKSL